MEQQLIDRIADGQYTCVAKGEKIDYQASGLGVRPIITPMRQDRSFFKGKQVADTVVGKAAALLLVLSGAVEVYGRVMSRSAVEVLKAHGVEYQYDELVDYIQNRTGDGMCPLEQSVLEEENPAKAFDKIEKKIAELMAAKQPSR